MTYTDNGTKIKQGYDWMPLAMANGIEWMSARKPYADRFDNLYRNRVGLSALLWYIGALIQFVYRHAASALFAGEK